MSMTCKQEDSSSSILAKPYLSLSMPCGLMPRTWASPRPSCPMVQLIICSAMRKVLLAYASLCLHSGGVSRPELQWEGSPTDCFGIGGLGLDVEMSGPLRTQTSSPCSSQCPGPAVRPSTPLIVWTEILLTNTNSDITASQHGDKTLKANPVL